MPKLRNITHNRQSIRLRDYDYTQNGAYFVTICAHERRCIFGHVMDGEMVLSEWGQIALEEWEQTAIVRPNVELDAFVVMPNHVHGVLVITESVGATRNNMTSAGATRNNMTSVGATRNNMTSVGATPNNMTSVGATPNNMTSVGATRNNMTSVGATRNNMTSVGATRNNMTSVGATRRVAPTSTTLQSGSLGAIIGQFKSAVTRRIHRLPHPPDHPIWQRNYYEPIIRSLSNRRGMLDHAL